MTNYTRGRAFEYKCKHDLQAMGYTVLRTAGSHGPADLIAFDKSTVIFAQCKNRPPTKKENEALEQFSATLPPSTRAVMIWRHERKTIYNELEKC